MTAEKIIRGPSLDELLEAFKFSHKKPLLQFTFETSFVTDGVPSDATTVKSTETRKYRVLGLDRSESRYHAELCITLWPEHGHGEFLGRYDVDTREGLLKAR